MRRELTRHDGPRPPRGRAVRVRAARRADRAAVVALWTEADRVHAELQPNYFRGDGKLDPRLVEGLEQASDARELFVAERDGLVIGFVLVELLDPARLSRTSRNRRGHIDTLVVASRVRRGGCGRKLVEAAAAWARARQVDEILLTVWKGNDSAEQFYTALGLQVISQVMRLRL